MPLTDLIGMPDFSIRKRRQPMIIAGEEGKVIPCNDEITILGTGPSKALAPLTLREATEMGCPEKGVQTFGVNRAFRFRQVDVGFAFDIIGGPTGMSIRDLDRGTNFLKEVAQAGIPYFFGAPDSDRPMPPNMIQYPIQLILREIGVVNFTSSIAYIMVYAVVMDVRKVNIFGVDMWCGNNHPEYNFEKPCLDYWLATMMARGMSVVMPATAALMDRNAMLHSLYGYNPQDRRYDRWVPKRIHKMLRAKNYDNFETSELINAIHTYLKPPNPTETKDPDAYGWDRTKIVNELKRRQNSG
ncbi:hypothetical protein LCGC14_1628550 [marine sediment metagenome]|uniref:Uncharacterized protein n=1 Tax=marine sediment metagenome TaxID=412755 RepID=A0A0F9I3P1_9ZZZZ